MKDTWQLTTTRTINLGHEQILVLVGQPGARVRVLYGDVWLTEESDGRDHFLSNGDELWLHGKRRSLIEALTPTVIEIMAPLKGGALQRWIRSLRARLRLALA